MHPAQTQWHSQPQSAPAAKSAAAAPGRIYAPTQDAGHAPSQNPMAQPTQTRTGGKAAAAAPGRISAPARDDGHAPSPNSSGTANPKAHRRPKPPQRHQAGQTHPRETQAMHPTRVQRAQPPKSAPAAKPPQQHPAEQTRQRKTKGLNARIRQDNSAHASHRAPTTRIRQRRAA